MSSIVVQADARASRWHAGLGVGSVAVGLLTFLTWLVGRAADILVLGVATVDDSGEGEPSNGYLLANDLYQFSGSAMLLGALGALGLGVASLVLGRDRALGVVGLLLATVLLLLLGMDTFG